MIFCDFLHCRSCRGGPLQQIWTRSHSGPPQESHTHHPAPNHPRHRADPGSRVIAPGEKGSVKVIQRAVMRARGAGLMMCSWWRSSAWTTYAPLDYLRAVGPFAFRWATRVPLGHPAGAALLECEMHISASGDLRRSPRDRRVTREHVPLADVLGGYPTCSRVTRRSRGLSDVLAGRRRHDMREAVPPCKTIGWVERGGRTAPDAVRPRRLTLPIPPRLAPSRAPERDSSGPSRTTPRITPGKRTRTPPNNSTGEEDASEQTVHHNLRAPRLQNHPRIIFRVCYASFAPLRSSTLHCTRRKGVAEGEEA